MTQQAEHDREETTYSSGWMQTLTGYRELMETGVPESQALRAKAKWESHLCQPGNGVVIYIEPEKGNEDDATERD